MNISEILLSGTLLGLFEVFAIIGFGAINKHYAAGWILVFLRTVGQIYTVIALEYYAVIIPILVVSVFYGNVFRKWYRDHIEPSPF